MPSLKTAAKETKQTVVLQIWQEQNEKTLCMDRGGGGGGMDWYGLCMIAARK